MYGKKQEVTKVVPFVKYVGKSIKCVKSHIYLHKADAAIMSEGVVVIFVH